MAQRFSPALTSFSGGEVGPLTYGRTDIQQYNESLRLCDNWIPTLQGPLVKRKGSKYIAETNGSNVARLIPYTDTDNTKYMLEWSENGTNFLIKIYNADGTDTGDSTTWNFDPSHDINLIQFAQKEDLLFVVHPQKEPYVFYYDGTTATITQQALDYGPLAPENIVLTDTVKVSAVSGAVTVQYYANGVAAQWPFISDTDLLAVRCVPQSLHDQWVTGTVYAIGAYVWSNSYESDRVNVYKATTAATSGTRAPGHDSGLEIDGGTGVTWEMVHSEYGFVRVAYTGNPIDIHLDGTVVGFPEVPIDSTTLTNGTQRFSPGLFGFSGKTSLSGTSNGPTSVTFHEQRVIYGGNSKGKTFISGSYIDQFTNFLPGSLLANASFKYSINSSENNDVRFMESAKSLLIGTDNGIFAARASSGGAITPTDIVIERDSNRGAKQQQPVQVGESVLFVQNGGQTVREIIFNNDTKGFLAGDLSILAHHFGENGFNRVAFQEEPSTIVWTFSDAGVLVGLTFERDAGVVAWHQHNLAADSTGAAVVEEVATLQDENGVSDKLWIVVKREINSSTVRYIEIIDSTATVWSDSHITYSGAATTTITGLSHLEGETVKVIGDGAVFPDAVVSSGQIVLASEVETADVGLAYVAKGKTQKIEGGAQTGTSQGKSKRIENVVLRVIDAGPGLLIGEDEGKQLDRVVYRMTYDLMDTPVPLYSGDTEIIPMDQNYESGGMIYFEHNLPFDCTITAMWPNMSVEDAR